MSCRVQERGRATLTTPPNGHVRQSSLSTRTSIVSTSMMKRNTMSCLLRLAERSNSNRASSTPWSKRRNTLEGRNKSFSPSVPCLQAPGPHVHVHAQDFSRFWAIPIWSRRTVSLALCGRMMRWEEGLHSVCLPRPYEFRYGGRVLRAGWQGGSSWPHSDERMVSQGADGPVVVLRI